MTYPPSGGSPDPYQPSQPYGQQPYDPTSPYPSDPYAAPASGTPASGAPSSGQPYPPPPPQFGSAHKGDPYGSAGYGQPPPYGQQPYAAPYPQAQTNTMAILALVFAFIFSPAAIIMGHVAKKQIQQTGEQGEGLATAGLWLGYIFTGLYVAFCALWGILVAAGIWGASTSTTGTY